MSPPIQVECSTGFTPDPDAFEAGFSRCPQTMLDDSIMRKNLVEPTDQSSDADRREADRESISVEVVLAWHFNPDQPVRYRSVDLSDTGIRVRSSTPLLEGMTGTLKTILPEGRHLDRPVMVVWARPGGDDHHSGFEAGLRFF